MPEEDQSKIEKLKKALYSREGVSRSAHILDLNTHESVIEDNWQKEQEELPPEVIVTAEEVEDNKSGLVKKILIASIFFFVISAGAAAFMFFNGSNVISPDKIDFSVVGPVMTPSGEELSLDINITNLNSTTIELVDLIVEYPKGTRSPFDKVTELNSERIAVGSIGSGETVRKTVVSVPFGEEDSEIVLMFDLEYRVQGSTSVFNKEFEHRVTLGTSPVTLKVDALKEINSNQDITFKVSLASNSSETLKNILLKADLPFGFTMTSSNPKPLGNKFIWKLGDIEPLGKRSIEIKGKVIGEQDQNRVFKFFAGTESSKQEGTISTTFSEVSHQVAIKRPFLAAEIIIDKTKGTEYVARSGDTLNLGVMYENNLSVPLTDIVIEAKIKGVGFDKKTIRTDTGFYRSSEDLIRWTKFENENLGSVLPREEGEVQFNVDIFDSGDSRGESLRRPEIFVDVTVKGKRLSESNVPEEIVSTASRAIKISSDLRLSARAVHSTGQIENQGPIPPKVDQKTEYGIIWTATNNFNEVEGAKVKAILPSYVTWTGVTTPTTEKVTYNADAREVTWDLGKVTAGSVSANNLRQVSFQVAFTPSLSQIGDSPNLVETATIRARDTFTNTEVSDSVKNVTTSISTDPSYQFGDDRVVE